MARVSKLVPVVTIPILGNNLALKQLHFEMWSILDYSLPERHQRHGGASVGTWWVQLQRTHTSVFQAQWQEMRGGGPQDEKGRGRAGGG